MFLEDAPLPRYNALCRVHECGRYCRRGDVVCRRHYYQLPLELRRSLWNGGPKDWVLALTWIDEHEAFT